METNKIYQGDTLTVLKTFPDDSIDCIITSPPYWGLRNYEVEGQIGLEKTLDEYLKKLLDITLELKRILKPSGVLWWNHGDCYGSHRDWTYSDIPLKAQLGEGGKKDKVKGMEKCLLLQNYRLILKMIDEQGWILRNSIIWHKPNHMPSSVKDRFSNSYEPVFMLVKNKKYWFDLDAVRVQHKSNFYKEKLVSKQSHQETKEINRYYRNKTLNESYKKSGIRNAPEPNEPNAFNPKGKNPGDVWEIPTQPFPGSHFATFPVKLIEPMILSSCPAEICKKCGKPRERISKLGEIISEGESNKGKLSKDKNYVGRTEHHGHKMVAKEHQTIGWTDCNCNAGWEPGIVLDPFFGSGTTGLAAMKLGRRYIGIELNPEYIKIAQKRLSQQSLIN